MAPSCFGKAQHAVRLWYGIACHTNAAHAVTSDHVKTTWRAGQLLTLSTGASLGSRVGCAGGAARMWLACPICRSSLYPWKGTRDGAVLSVVLGDDGVGVARAVACTCSRASAMKSMVHHAKQLHAHMTGKAGRPCTSMLEAACMFSLPRQLPINAPTAARHCTWRPRPVAGSTVR